MTVPELTPFRAPPVRPLGYAGPSTRAAVPSPFKSTALRIAVGCWAVPLAAGTVAFAGGIASHVSGLRGGFDVFAGVGVWTLVGGVVLSGVGGVAVLVFAAARWSSTVGERWTMLVRPALLVLVLIGSNYVAAFAMIWIVGAFVH